MVTVQNRSMIIKYIAVMMSLASIGPGAEDLPVAGVADQCRWDCLGLALGYIASWAGGHYHFIHLSAEVYSIDTCPLRRDCLTVDRVGRVDRNFVAGDGVSVVVGCARAAG